MQRYKDYAPTGFDSKGLNLPGQQNWLVVPVGLTRDSGSFEESNFEAAIELLDGESDTVEVHRFGHWACGWFEIIIVDPKSKQADKAKGIETALENYPLLDEESYCLKQHEATAEYWDFMSMDSRIDYLNENNDSIFAARCKGHDLYDRAQKTYYQIEGSM